MSFWIHRRDTKLRFVTKFGENRPLQSSRKVATHGLPNKNNSGYAELVPAPILAKMGRSRPKFPERCHPLICTCVPNLVRIGCVLPDLFRKDWFFGPKSRYNIGFQPTIMTAVYRLIGHLTTFAARTSISYSSCSIWDNRPPWASSLPSVLPYIHTEMQLQSHTSSSFANNKPVNE